MKKQDGNGILTF